MVIDWTGTAKQHLKGIFDYYIEVASKPIAKKLATDIRNAAKPLAKHPEMGAKEPLLEPEDYRYLVVRKHYKLIYYFDSNTIYIVAVWDCRRNPNDLKI